MKQEMFCVVVEVLLLLLACNAVGSLAVDWQQRRCSFDDVSRRNGPPVIVRELPRSGQGAWQAYTVSKSEEWAPLRINVSTMDLKIKKKYCTATGDVRVDFLTGEELKCTYKDVMTPTKRKVLLKRILPVAVKLHTERLLVQPASAPFVMPEFTENNKVCSRFTVPKRHRRSPGVDDADFVLYVGSGPKKSESSATWAVPCAVNENKRPVAGAMYVYPGIIYYQRGAVRVLAHELAHALGFNYENLRKLKMTKVMTIRGGERNVVISPKTLEKAKEHYGCESLKGMELEDAADGKESSHWEWRNAKDELMSSFSFADGIHDIGYYTALTIATFEDMGYYKGNFSMAEPMGWSHKAGCTFLTEKSKKKLERNYPNMFCKEPGVTSTASCASSRLGPGYCFESPLLGTNLSVLYPYPSELCEKRKDADKYYGLAGPSSRCLDGASLVRRTSSDEKVTVDGFCASVRCRDGVVSVQTDVEGEWHTCNEEGQIITPRSTSHFTYVSGGVKCPKYSEVCTVGPDGGSLIGANFGKAEKNPDH